MTAQSAKAKKGHFDHSEKLCNDWATSNGETAKSPKAKKWHSKPPCNGRSIFKPPDMAFLATAE